MPAIGCIRARVSVVRHGARPAISHRPDASRSYLLLPLVSDPLLPAEIAFQSGASLSHWSISKYAIKETLIASQNILHGGAVLPSGEVYHHRE
jgi:hypothetical protein